MEKQRIIIPAPNGGLHSSVAPTLIGDGELAVAENVEFVSGRLRKRPGNAECPYTINTLSTYPRKAYNFILPDGSEIPLEYERGATGTVREIYWANTATDPWTWANLETAEDTSLVLTNARTPRFLTASSMLLFSNGDETDGLMYWDGSGYVLKTVDEGDGGYTITAKFLASWKNRVIGANGEYYIDPDWSDEFTSGLFFSSLLKDSTVLKPYESDAWWEVDDNYLQVNPEDGSEIVALWVWKDAIFVGKTTGIWRLYGESPETLSSAKVSKIGMESDHSLQLIPNKNFYIFHNKDGFHAFDGSNDAVRIDEKIKDKVFQIPRLDTIEGDLSHTIDALADWNNHNDTDETEDISVNTGGYIELVKTEQELRIDAPTPPFTDTWDVTGDGYTGFGFSIYMPESDIAKFFITQIKIVMSRADGQYGSVYFEIYKRGRFYPYPVEQQIGNTVEVDINDIVDSTVSTIDFSDADVVLGEHTNYWLIVRWSSPGITDISMITKSGTSKMIIFRNSVGAYVDVLVGHGGHLRVYGNYYEEDGEYHTLDNAIELDDTPGAWGEFEVKHEVGSKIHYYMRTSPDAIVWTPLLFENAEVEPNKQIDENTFPFNKYIDLKVTLDRESLIVSPEVDYIIINAYLTSGEVTDRFACSTIFENKYMYATNKNLDGEYRTFVLDEDGSWSINPDQHIVSFLDYKKEKWLMTVDTNAKLHRMYKGEQPEDYYYDYSLMKATSSENYVMKVETKKYDCNAPNVLKLFREANISVGSVLGTNYVDGKIEYRIDSGDWNTQYFQDTQNTGDTSIIRLSFPAGTRGYYIQFRFETYSSDDNYGNPYNLKDISLTYYTQKIKPLTSTTTAEPSETGQLVDE